jgi:hypothetical protein
VSVNWKVVFRDAVTGLAGVTVYDKGQSDCLGRYVIAKVMRMSNGRNRTTQSYCCQRPAALRRANKFLCVRAALAGCEYVPGDGERTWMFKPVGVEFRGAVNWRAMLEEMKAELLPVTGGES